MDSFVTECFLGPKVWIKTSFVFCFMDKQMKGFETSGSARAGAEVKAVFKVSNVLFSLSPD